jgi:hypothetical protein
VLEEITPCRLVEQSWWRSIDLPGAAAVGIGRLERLEMGSEASNWEPLGMVVNALTMKEKIKAIGTSSGKRLEVVALDKFLGGWCGDVRSFRKQPWRDSLSINS